jgi:hypothetical protein
MASAMATKNDTLNVVAVNASAGGVLGSWLSNPCVELIEPDG